MADLQAIAIHATHKSQCSPALLLQAYALSVKAQTPVDLASQCHQTRINDGLTAAQESAHHYMQVIQPNLVANILNIRDYFALNPTVAGRLPEGCSEAQWRESLAQLQYRATHYQTIAEQVINQLQTFQDNLVTDLLALRNPYQPLCNPVKSAIDATNALEEVWNYLSADLESLISNLNQGLQNLRAILRNPALHAANLDVQDVIQDINAMIQQMTGVEIADRWGQTIDTTLIIPVQYIMAVA